MTQETIPSVVQLRKASVEARISGMSEKTRSFLNELNTDMRGLATEGWALAEAYLSELRGQPLEASAELEASETPALEEKAEEAKEEAVEAEVVEASTSEPAPA